MLRRPPRPTRPDTRVPYATLCRSGSNRIESILREGQPAITPALAATHPSGMRLREIEDEQPRGWGLLLDAAALDHRPAGLGHRYDQGLVDVGRVVLAGEFVAHHSVAGRGVRTRVL